MKIYEEKEYQRLSALVSSLAINIDGDQHEKILNKYPWVDDITKVDQDPDYHAIFEKLNQAHVSNNLSSAIYTLVYDNDEDLFYFGVRSDSFVYYKHKYEIFPEILVEKMDSGGVIPRYQDENGEWLSAFYPIKNSKDQTVALLEADVDFGYFQQMVFDHYKKQALISLAVIVLMALFLIPYTKKILREDEEIKKELLIQKQLIEKKNKDINDSINYARKIQESLLPNIQHIADALPHSFIYYRPKDIVSGDFYWFTEKNGKILLAAADCTGHGIPGALMSMIGHSKLNSITVHVDTTHPGEILNQLDKAVSHAFGVKRYDFESKDGMDIALCSFDPKTKSLEFSGAFRPLLQINDNGIKEIKGDRFPIGGGSSYEKNEFKTHSISVTEGDSYYIYSDGFSDQFGGPKGKKYLNKQFKELLQSIRLLSTDEQIQKLDETFTNWKGDNEQVDDVLIIGLRF